MLKSLSSLDAFIDEVHTIVGAGQGGGEGGLDVANVFKPMMARGELNLIGATTLNEYQKYIEKDAALERRFQPVMVPEPTVAQTMMILRGLRDTFEAHHKVSITEDAIIAAAEQAVQRARGLAAAAASDLGWRGVDSGRDESALHASAKRPRSARSTYNPRFGRAETSAAAASPAP